MADHEIVEAYGEDRVPSARRALLIVVERSDAGNEHLMDLVFAWPAEHHRLASDGLETRMTKVLVRDGDDRSLGLGDGVTRFGVRRVTPSPRPRLRSEEHTSELQSPCNFVCRLLLEKKKT